MDVSVVEILKIQCVIIDDKKHIYIQLRMLYMNEHRFKEISLIIDIRIGTTVHVVSTGGK